MTVIGVLGTTHDPALRARYHYPLSLLKDAITAFRPDVICGEVMPESWPRLQEDPRYTAEDFIEPPSEYDELIFPLCRERGIEFVPIDWCELDVWGNFDPLEPYSSDARPALEARLAEWDDRIRATWDQSAIPFNSQAYDDLARAKYEWIASINPVAAMVQWTSRNHIMAQRIRNAAARHAGRRILVVVGADHNYLVADLLRGGDWELVYPLRPI